MDISLIGEHAGSVWNTLHVSGGLDLTNLKKETGLGNAELAAAIGWLAREGKIQTKTVKKGRRNVQQFVLVEEEEA